MEIRRTNILGFSLLLVGLVLCCIGLWLLLNPTPYRAIVNISVAPDDISYEKDGQYVPNFIVYTIERFQLEVQSEAVLTNVILALNLNDVWGKKYAGGNKLETSRTVEWLKKRIEIQKRADAPSTLRGTISMTSEDPKEAAKIANAVAEAYQHFRDEQKRQLLLNGIKVLEETFQREEQQIKTQREMVKQLKGKIPEPIPELPSPAVILSPLPDKTNQPLDTNAVSYFEAARKLANMKELHKLLAYKIEAEKYPRILNSEVEIEDLAALPQTPVGPNRQLGAITLLAGLAILLLGFRLVRLSAHQPS